MGEERILTATFKGGSQTIGRIVSTLQRFNAVLTIAAKKELEREHARAKWIVRNMSYASPLQIIAEPELPAKIEHYRAPIVRRVRHIIDGAERRAYNGEAAEERKAGDALRDIMAGHFDELTVTTDAGLVSMLRPAEKKEPPSVRLSKEPSISDANAPTYGTVVGMVQRLSTRQAPVFTIYDVTTDEPIICYADAETRPWLENIVDKVVEVDGLIGRDPVTGRPKVVKSITRVEQAETADEAALGRLVGLFPKPLPEPAEVLIKRLRHAGS